MAEVAYGSMVEALEPTMEVKLAGRKEATEWDVGGVRSAVELSAGLSVIPSVTAANEARAANATVVMFTDFGTGDGLTPEQKELAESYGKTLAGQVATDAAEDPGKHEHDHIFIYKCDKAECGWVTTVSFATCVHA